MMQKRPAYPDFYFLAVVTLNIAIPPAVQLSSIFYWSNGSQLTAHRDAGSWLNIFCYPSLVFCSCIPDLCGATATGFASWQIKVRTANVEKFTMNTGNSETNEPMNLPF